MSRKRKRFEEDDYLDFCSGLQRKTSDGSGDHSFVSSRSRPLKRPRINPNYYTRGEVRYRYMHEDEPIYKKIKGLIKNHTIILDDLVEVHNDALKKAYSDKKAEKRQQFGGKLKEKLVFHGTKERNIGSICRFNFDWRLTGTNRGHKFGKGVCFSPSAKYASSYSDQSAFHKVMIVAKVLVAKVCKGHHDMSIPPPGYDTSQKGQSGIVLVKYEDNEFYPAYVLHYHFRVPNKYEYNPYNYAYNPYRYHDSYSNHRYSGNNHCDRHSRRYSDGYHSWDSSGHGYSDSSRDSHYHSDSSSNGRFRSDHYDMRREKKRSRYSAHKPDFSSDHCDDNISYFSFN